MIGLLVADTEVAVEPADIEPAVRRALPEIVARVRRRHPAASPEVVQRCIEAAMRQLQDARVRAYLPILIERSASASLRDQPG